MLVGFGYKFWKGRDGKVHWAQLVWKDDGIGGVATHGSAESLPIAVSRALIADKAREGV